MAEPPGDLFLIARQRHKRAPTSHPRRPPKVISRSATQGMSGVVTTYRGSVDQKHRVWNSRNARRE